MGKSQQFNVDIKFNSEPVYDDNDKYTDTKIKIYRDKANTNFQDKIVSKEMFVINNVRFCYYNKQKVLSSNTFGRM